MLMDAIWENKITEAQRINRAKGFFDHGIRWAQDAGNSLQLILLKMLG